MLVNINSKDVKLTDKMKSLVNKKLGETVTKYVKKIPHDKVAEVRVRKGSRFGYRVSFSMNLVGNFKIFAEAKAKTFIESLTSLREKLERQLLEFKRKRK